MKKYLVVIFILITSLITAQSDYQLIVKGSLEDVVMNPAYSPDGSKIAYTKSNYQGIWIYEFQTQTNYLLTDEPAAGFAFKWSSDSKSILTRVAKYEEMKRYNAVKIFDVTTGKSKQLSDYKTMMPYLPMWADGDSKIYLPLKGNDEVFLSAKEKNNRFANSTIAFEKSNKVIIKNLSNNSEQMFEPIKDAQYINLSVSPDGSKIVFEVMGGNLFTLNIDGTNLIDLGKGNRPRWSFDSNKIIYMIAEDDGHDYTASDIYIINANGTQKINLTNTNNVIEMNPCYAPDGKSIVFDVVNDGSIYLMSIE
jgi:Tol biopolymer transport system component